MIRQRGARQRLDTGMEYLIFVAHNERDSGDNGPIQDYLDFDLVPRPLASMQPFLIKDILDKLVVLNISNCGLEKVPACLSALPCLQELDMSRNRLTHCAAQFITTNLPFLKILDLSDNYLTDVEELQHLGVLNDLEILNLEGNPLPFAASRCEALRTLLFQTAHIEGFSSRVRQLHATHRTNAKYSPFLLLGSYKTIVTNYASAVSNAVKASLAVKYGSYDALDNKEYLRKQLSIDIHKLTNGSFFSRSSWTGEGIVISGPGCVLLGDARLEAPMVYVGKRDDILNTYNSCLGATVTYSNMIRRKVKDVESAANTGISQSKLTKTPLDNYSDNDHLRFFGNLNFSYLESYTEQQSVFLNITKKPVSTSEYLQKKARSHSLIISTASAGMIESCGANRATDMPADIEASLAKKGRTQQFFINLNQRPLRSIDSPFPRLRILNNLVITVDDYDRAKQLNNTVQYTNYLLSPRAQFRSTRRNSATRRGTSKEKSTLGLLSSTRSCCIPPSEILQQRQFADRNRQNTRKLEQQVCSHLKQFIMTGEADLSTEETSEDLLKASNEGESDFLDSNNITDVAYTRSTRKGWPENACINDPAIFDRDADLHHLDQYPTAVELNSDALNSVPSENSVMRVSELGTARSGITGSLALDKHALEEKEAKLRNKSGTNALKNSSIAFTSNAFKAIDSSQQISKGMPRQSQILNKNKTDVTDYALSMASTTNVGGTIVDDGIMNHLVESTPSVGVMHARAKSHFMKTRPLSTTLQGPSTRASMEAKEACPSRLEQVTLESLITKQANDRLSEQHQQRKREIAASENMLRAPGLKTTLGIIDDDALAVQRDTVAKAAEPLDMLIRNADTTEEFDRIMSLDGQFRASKISPEYNLSYGIKMFRKSSKTSGNPVNPIENVEDTEENTIGTTVADSVATRPAHSTEQDDNEDAYTRLVKASISQNPLKLEMNAISYEKMANPEFHDKDLVPNTRVAEKITPTFIDIIQEEYKLQKNATDKMFVEAAKNMDKKIRQSITRPSSQIFVRNTPQARFSANSDTDPSAKINRHSVLLDVAMQGERLAGDVNLLQDQFTGKIPANIIAEAQQLTNKIANPKKSRVSSATSPSRKPSTRLSPSPKASLARSIRPMSATRIGKTSGNVLSYTSREIMQAVDTQLYRQQLSMEKSRYRSSSNRTITKSDADERRERKSTMKLLYQNNEALMQQERQARHQEHLDRIALIKNTPSRSYMTEEKNAGIAVYKNEARRARTISERNRNMSKTSNTAEEIRRFACNDKLRYQGLSSAELANGVVISTGELVKPLNVPCLEEAVEHAGKIKVTPLELISLSTEVIKNVDSNLKSLSTAGEQFLNDELAWEEMMQDPDYKFQRTTDRMAMYSSVNNSKLDASRIQNLHVLTSSSMPINEAGQHMNGILQEMAFRADAGLTLKGFTPGEQSPVHARASEARCIAQQLLQKASGKSLRTNSKTRSL